MPEAELRISPEQLIALNDEIASLVRAGVPLEMGLTALRGSVPSALGRVSDLVSQRMREGQSLGESLSTSIPELPRVYTAVVEAGLKSGNLPRALESMSRFAQQGLELRQRIEFAFIYPLFVFLLAYVFFVVFIKEVGLHWTQIWSEFLGESHPSVQVLLWLSANLAAWFWIPPAIIAGLVMWWMVAGRLSFLPDRPSSRLLHMIPGLHSIIVLWHWANFCDLLATLMEHHVPLPSALALAADATGNPIISREISAVAQQVATGQSIRDCVRTRTQIPPYIRWTLSADQQPLAVQNALRHGVEIYRNRATFRADLIKMFLPLLLVLVFGFIPVLLYAISLALPLRAFYEQLNLDSMR